jgi:predicted ATP-grasp superfamily ATP-dependent carboligase
MTAKIPALVIGSGINGLGVARSLARARVPAWLLDADVQRPEMRTRAAKPLAIRALHGDTLVDELVRLGSTQFAGVRPVLFLTQEESVRTVSQQRDRLALLFRFNLPSAELVETLQHKYGFQQLAERFDAPIPRLVHVRGASDMPALESLRYPVAVKPGERDAGYSQQFKKAYRVESAGECAALVKRILAVMADVVVQEWIEGADSAIHFCLQYLDRDGRVVASFTGRKVRSWPPQVGGTASCLPAPEAGAELARMTTQFFRDAGVVGMASMEYKRDAASGQFRMVEPTIGRTDYQEEVATLNGVNLPYAAYCCALGLPIPAAGTVRRSSAWRVQSEDTQSAAAQHQPPRSGFDRVDTVTDALWRGSDPMPWLVETLAHVSRAIRNRMMKTMPGQSSEGNKT